METKFQTSFIPKKPLSTVPGGPVVVPHKSRGSGTSSLFMTLSALIFICSLLAIGGALGWKQYLLAKQDGYKAELSERQKQFDVNEIAQLKVESTKIQLAKQLLADRLLSSRLFTVFSTLTVQNVRFTGMEMDSAAGAEGPLTLALTGYGKDFASVAFQADVLNRLGEYGLTAVVKNPIVSNPELEKDGTVSFELTATINPKALPNNAQ